VRDIYAVAITLLSAKAIGPDPHLEHVLLHVDPLHEEN
jgi:hypothetical protein